jgi:integrase
MVKRPRWWDFLGIGEDGWSSVFPSVDLLLKHLGRKSRSISSRDTYCYILRDLCLALDANPDEFILRASDDPDASAKAVQDMADKYHNRGSTRYANEIIHVAKTFLKVSKIEPDLHGYFQPVRSRRRPEYIPNLQEALRMADVAGNLRDKLMILLLTYAGLRNSTLRALAYSENYPDLLLQDFTLKKEFEKRNVCLVIVVHEIMKLRVPNACKNRVFYYAFVPPTVTDCFYLYLCEMERKYGPLPDDFLIFPTMNRKIPLRQRLRTPISLRELELIVKKAAERAGIKNWKYVYPHCLRKTYESFLRNQPDDVRLDAKEREFLFGHTLPGSQDTYFDKTKIEEMREKYAKMIFEPDVKVKREERVIGEDELQSYLQNGWHFEATLPSQRIVVSREVKVKQSQDANIKDGAQKSDTQIRNKTSSQEHIPEPSPPNSNSGKADISPVASKTATSDVQETVLRNLLEQGKSETPVDQKDRNPSLDNDMAKKQSRAAESCRQSSLLDFGKKDQDSLVK